MKSTRSRRDFDDLAFSSLHGVKASGAATTPSTASMRSISEGQGQGVHHLSEEQARFWEQPINGDTRAHQYIRRPNDLETEIM